MKLSFSFPSSAKPSARPPSAAAAAIAADEAENLSPNPSSRFITHFDPSAPPSAGSATRPAAVIAPIPNSIQRRPTSLPLPEDEADDGPSGFVLDTTAGSDANSGSSYGLILRQDGPAAANPARPAEASDAALKRYRQDMESLPDHRGMAEFEDIDVEDFGRAVLAGYGWVEGKGIGRNNTRGDTKIVEYEHRGAGTSGLGYTPSSDGPKKRHGDWVVGESKRGSIKSMEDSKKEGNETARGKDNEEHTREERKSERHSRPGSASNGQSYKHREEGRKRSRVDDGGSKVVRWLHSNIRVRIIDKKFMHGRMYKKKGVIVDVVGPSVCNIKMDESGELLQGVDQVMLETALPKRDGPVLVLYGSNKGVYGSLVEKDLDKEMGMVRDADSQNMIKVQLDQIAEYLGDPSFLGY